MSRKPEPRADQSLLIRGELEEMVSKKRIFAIATRVLLVAILSGLMVSPALGQPPERVKVFIGFKSQPGLAEQALVRGVGGRIRYTYHLVPAIAASVPESAIQGLLNNPNITSIEPVIAVYAVDAELDDSWGVDRIGAGTVHDGGNKGTGVKVAVIDTGIDKDHPDLKSNIEGGVNFVRKDPTAWDDDNGHGTHVAGTIAAVDNEIGVIGVAPEAHLYGVKVLDRRGGGSYSDVIAGLQWAVDNGMQVTNNSYGSSGDPGATVKQAFDNAYAAGILNVCAAGNEGAGENTVIYPARYESCVAVAATDIDDNRASFSSTGPDVELAAPGVNINSTVLGGGYQDGWNGTSMASPHVAGTAALVLAANPGWGNDQVRTQLQTTADDLGDPGRDTKYGYGLVDADEAAAAPATTGSIAGTVTNVSDGTVIEGATVSADTGQSATTAADGTYTITDVPTGDRSVTASADGFESQTKTAAVTENETTTVDFALNPLTTATTVTVSSITYATQGGRNNDKHLNITVALVDDLGNAVAGASVSIDLFLDDSPYGSGTGTTGTEGTVTFTLNNAPSGCYTTTVTDVTADGLTWDGATPENGFCKYK